MQIKHVLFCEESRMGTDGKPIISGLLPDYIVLPYKPQKGRPVLYSFAVVITTIMKGEFTPGVINIRVEAPDGTLMGEGTSTDGETRPRNVVKNEAGLYSTYTSVDLRNFPFEQLGDYKFIVKTPTDEKTAILKVTYGEPQ